MSEIQQIDDAVALYNKGNEAGMHHEFAVAYECFQKAAKQGYAPAQFNLGFCYEKGQGVPRNFTKAIEYYQKAAEQNYAPAQCNLGWCYESGNGVTPDINKAFE